MKRPDRSFIARLALELLIVFLGVYLAFLFNAHGERTKMRARQVQLLYGLHTEVDFFLSGAVRRSPVMNESFAGWKEKLAERAVQAPPYFVMEGDDLPTTSMWQVVIFFDGMQLLDVPTMFELSKYYNSFGIMLSKYEKLIEFAEHEIIPFEDAPSRFYDDNGRLRAAYRAYIDRYEDFLNLFQTMIDQSNRVKAVLESEMINLGIEMDRLNPAASAGD